ncbi:GT2 family glycosyltransferase [Streptomyces zagrosensis]|uniref:GT2 family glycosyltransferase n=1 Tax=Streptomyces zagrosensis TaxID=1042984 RepID=A0A7W9QF28_9ACTN|nr:GT2 family glycosyltransferase [Streptomyces zagrosensis]
MHSQPAASYPAAPTEFAPAHGGAASSTPEFPRHVVTAVLVSHDGARWLPDALAGLLGQERPVQSAVAADTGSADDSAQLLTAALGRERVLHLARRSGFGTAVDEAVRGAPMLTPDQLPYLKRPSGWDPVTRSWRDDAYDMPELPHGEPVQWLWLLHDDCAPEPTALSELLRVADASPRAAIVGPKLRSWYDKRQLLEVGVSIARSGRRWTGLERREQDQGQHDQVRPVLAVSSAGMLIRREVWEELGGFDARLPLMRDDVDLCWRAQALGHQVLIAPDAVVRHAEAAARERRPIDCVGRAGGPTVADGEQDSAASRRTPRRSSPHRVDKSGAVYTLLANTRGALFPYVLLRVVLGTLLRTLGYLVGKAPAQAVDEFAGLCTVLLRPERVLAARRQRGRPVVEASELRPLFPPPGATMRATVEQIASNFGGRTEPELVSGGRHGVVESGPGGDDADFLEVEQFARLKRVARKPGPVLFVVLLLVSLIACRDLIGGGSLAGGALLPAPGDVGDLWGRYTDTWQPVGVGAADGGPPYLAVLAALASVFLGSTGFTLTLLLVCSVPLAGLAAYFASRPLVGSRLLRAWGSVAYALLPATTGALASGRLGTAVLAVLLPLMARAAVSAAGLTLGRGGGRQVPGWRAVWAYVLLLSLTMAFTPVVWPIAVLLGIAVLGLRAAGGGGGGGAQLVAYGTRFLAVALTPLLVLAPWSLSLLSDPGRLLEEAGLNEVRGSASALELLTLSPGGPKTASALLLVGVVLAALAALLRSGRQLAVRAAWVAALAGFLFAALAGADHWAGPATLVYGLALLCAGLVGAEGARARVAEQSFGWRQPVAALIALAAGLAPLIAACSWMLSGADGPIERRDPVQVPAFVAEEASTRDQARTLVLDGTAARVDYILVRGSGARLGDAEAATESGGDKRLDDVVAHLVAGSGADQTRELGGYAVRYVLVRDSAPRQLGRVLDTTPGLTRLSQQDGSALWRVDQRVSRVSVVQPAKGDAAGTGSTGSTGAAKDAGTVPVPVAAGPVEAHGTVPDGPAGRVLRVADKAAPGWQATLDGKELKRITVDGWAQGFELPATGGQLHLTYETPVSHTLWVWAQALFALVLLVLALPDRRREIDDDLPVANAPTGPATTTATGPATASAPVGGPVGGPAGGPDDGAPAQAPSGGGRRARRLRAAAQATGEAHEGAGTTLGQAPPGTPPSSPGMPAAPPPLSPLAPPPPGAPPDAPADGPPAADPMADPMIDPYAVPQQGYGQQWDHATGYAAGQPGYQPYQQPHPNQGPDQQPHQGQGQGQGQGQSQATDPAQDPYQQPPQVPYQQSYPDLYQQGTGYQQGADAGYQGAPYPGSQPGQAPTGYPSGGQQADPYQRDAYQSGQSGQSGYGGAYPPGQAAPYPDGPAPDGTYQDGSDPYGYGPPYPAANPGAAQDDTTYGDGTNPEPRRDGSES